MDSKAKIAALEVIQAEYSKCPDSDTGDSFLFRLEARKIDSQVESIELIGRGETLESAIADAISGLCIRPIQINHSRQLQQNDGCYQCVVTVGESLTGDASSSPREGAGRYVSRTIELGLAVAAIRAANHAGVLKLEFRAKHQKMLRHCSQELVDELTEVLALGSLGKQKRLEADSVTLDHLNRVASAAVVTAANSPQPKSILGLFDTSAWLYDSQGRKRPSFTDTQLWFAWYPGLDEPDRIVDAVIRSMPATPSSKIPWIVRLFENPESWIRFRGAVDLEDHDVLHVLLGRGLQDQDEAFVLGFAMGTSKRVRWWEYYFFQFLIARIYPEPYRIPRFLHPAFILGVKCGCETGNKDLFKASLKRLKSLTIAEARREAGIDPQVLRGYYRQEQIAIPITIASLRL